MHTFSMGMIMLVDATCLIPFKLRSPRVYDVDTWSMPFLLRWHYVNPVLATLSLCLYHVL